MLMITLLIAGIGNLVLTYGPAAALYDELRTWGWSLGRDVTDPLLTIAVLLGNAAVFFWAAWS